MLSPSFSSEPSSPFSNPSQQIDRSKVGSGEQASRSPVTSILGAMKGLPFKRSFLILGFGSLAVGQVLGSIYGPNPLIRPALEVDLVVFGVGFATVSVIHLAIYILEQCCEIARRYGDLRKTCSEVRYQVSEAAKHPESIPDSPCICGSGEVSKLCCRKK
jgi:hypothetical protein